MVKRCAAVSSFGRFRSTRGVVSTPSVRADGYSEVAIDGKRYKLHRLVASAFRLPKTEDQNQVNHKDGNPSNNRLDNLEWVTRSENILHSYKTNTNRASCALRKSKPVRARKLGSDDWVEFPSKHDASRILGIDRANIQNCLRGKYQQICGYNFEYGAPVEPPLLEGEEWRDAHEGARVSSFGRMQTRDGIIYTPKPATSGYCSVMIASTSFLVHRMVAKAFLPPPPTPLHIEVNHKDGNPSNNNVHNLEWCTKSENVKHSYETNVKRASNVVRRVKPVRARRIGSNDDDWTVYPGGASEAARILGINQGNITRNCAGTRPSAHGYIFEYDEPTEAEELYGEVWADVLL